MGRVSAPPELVVRRAGPGDVAAIGRLLHDFNTEYDEPTPSPEALAERFRELLAGDTVVLLGGGGPDGIAVLRFRPAIWTTAISAPPAVAMTMERRSFSSLALSTAAFRKLPGV